MQYLVTAANSSGKTVKVVVESDSAKSARSKAKSMGLIPMSVAISNSKSINKTSGLPTQISSIGGVKKIDVVNMTRQLASLINSNVPVVDSFNALIDQIDNKKLKSILAAIKQNVKEGRSLSESFGNYPKVFDKIYINLIHAGESSGKLGPVLVRMADFLEDQEKLKSKTTGALMYPLILVCVAMIALVFIFTFVVPEIIAIFEDTDMDLPMPTKILIALSDFFKTYWKHLLIGVTLFIFLTRRFFKTEKGRKWRDKKLITIPALGKLIRNIIVARVTRTLGTLLDSGVSMMNALEISRNVSNNVVFEEAIEKSKSMVSEGRALAYSFKQSKQFPPIVVHMIGVGEKTGELEKMLVGVASNFESQIDANLHKVTSLLSPILIVVMALIVGFIVAGVLLPMLDMTKFA